MLRASGIRINRGLYTINWISVFTPASPSDIIVTISRFKMSWIARNAGMDFRKHKSGIGTVIDRITTRVDPMPLWHLYTLHIIQIVIQHQPYRCNPVKAAISPVMQFLPTPDALHYTSTYTSPTNFALLIFHPSQVFNFGLTSRKKFSLPFPLPSSFPA